MTDIVAEPIQDFEEQEVYELKKSQHSNLSVTPKKSQKGEVEDDQKPFEKEIDNAVQHEEPRTQEHTQQSLHYHDLVNDTLAQTQDQGEVQRELIELHVQIDKILNLYKPQAPGPYSYYLDEINHNGSFERVSAQDFRLEELLRSPMEQVKSSYIDRPTEHIQSESLYRSRPAEYQFESTYKSTPAEFQYQSSSHQQESFRPKYDKEKLDTIIRKILGGKSGYRALENFRSTNITHNQVTLPRNYVSEAPKQSGRYQETVKKAAPVAALKSRPHFCGDCENDVDSLVEDHMGEAANEIKLKSNDHTNFYVGSLVDDEEEVPRVKKIGKRKEIQTVKKQSNAAVNKGHKDFVLKGTYEKKSQEQNKAIEPHKFFDKNEEEIKDFVF